MSSVDGSQKLGQTAEETHYLLNGLMTLIARNLFAEITLRSSQGRLVSPHCIYFLLSLQWFYQWQKLV